MKLADVILLSLAVCFLIIGIHQIMTVGFGEAYWIIMLFVALFFIYSLRKSKEGK
jgi:predicted membrane protein